MTSTSDDVAGLGRTPGVIPYVEWHAGPRRALTLDLTTGNSVAGNRMRPVVGVDGRQYVVVWGSVTFEVPADRNVHVSVHVEGETLTQVASALLPPSDGDLRMRYETHYSTGVGTLALVGAPGRPGQG